MITSAARLCQLKPLSSVQTEAVPPNGTSGSPRNVKSERLGRLSERKAGGSAGSIPNRMLPRPFVGNARPNFAAEDVEIKLEIGAFFIDPRQVDGDRLKIEPAGEIHPADGKTIFLPFGRAADLRKRLSKHGRRDREI